MDIIGEALAFEETSLKALSRNERIKISRKAKELVLSLNEIYKKEKDRQIMDIMKRITQIKRQVEKRL